MLTKFVLGAAVLAASANAQVTAAGPMGVTNPTAAVMGTPINQTSNARLLSLNSANDFCVFAPPEPNSVIGDTEEVAVAWCIQPRNNARVIPDGTFHSVAFVRTPLYYQVHGYGDFTRLNIQDLDAGGEMDPHGAKNTGNPAGGNVTCNATGTDVSYEEWMNFMSYNQFCLRICIAESGPYTVEQQCQHEIDLMGCQWVMPGDYTNGTFTDCEAEPALPPGWFPQPDGSISTFHQRYTGTNTANGATDLWTIGVTVTPEQPAMTPKSSKCTTFSSVGNGIPTASLGREAAFSWTGALPDAGTMHAPTASATDAAADGKKLEDPVAAAGASGGTINAKSAAGENYAVAGAVSLVAVLVGVAAVVL